MRVYNNFYGPLLDPPQYIYAPYSKKPRTEQSIRDVALLVLMRGKGLKDYLPQGSGRALNAGQDTISLFCDKGKLLTYVQFGVQQDLPVLLHRAAFQLDCPQQPPSCTALDFSISDADFTFPLIGFHKIPVSPFSCLSRFLWMTA